MLGFLFKKEIEALIGKAFREGLTHGFELGYKTAQSERTNRGFIIGSKVDQQIAQLLKEKGII